MSDVKRCKHGRNFCLECHDEKDAAAALLVECERLRKERDSHQRLCIAEMEKNRQLLAELEAIRGQQPDWCKTMERPKSQCGCPDCGSSLVEVTGLPPQQPDAVSVPMELLRRLLDSNNRNTFCAGTYLKAHDELSALLSTKNAEEGE